MKALGALLAALVIPFAVLNAFGGLIAGIWLAILGEWSAIFLGLAILFAGAIAASLLLLPGLALGGLGAMAMARGSKLVGWLFIVLASPWTYLAIIAWEVVIFSLFSKRFTDHNIIPMWLWSYGAATGVWSYMASKEERSGGGGSASLAAFAAQVAYIVLSVCYLVLGWPFRESVLAMTIPIFVMVALGLTMVILSTKANSADADYQSSVSSSS